MITIKCFKSLKYIWGFFQESNQNEFSNPTESSEKDANTSTETSEATPSAESSEISLKLSDSIGMSNF